MLILGFMLLFIIPLFILYTSTQQETKDQLTEGQVLHIANTIRDAAERVYYAGEPAQEELELYFPEGIDSVLFDHSTIAFSVQGANDYEVTVGGVAPLNGTFRTSRGLHVITVRAENGTVQVSE